MGTTGRTLVVKAVGYQAVRATTEDWEPPRIEEELALIKAKAPKVRDRHYPSLAKTIFDGTRCAFINDFKDLGKGKGYIFTVCSYVKGHVPETFSPNMDDPKIDVTMMDLTDEDGDPKELAYTYRCLAFGQVIIVENVPGAGGISTLAKLLRSLLKTYRAKGHGLLELSDIASSDLRSLIDSKGGIRTVRARLVHDARGKGSPFARRLTDLRRTVGGANKCLVSWEADDNGEIDADSAINMLDEAEESALDSVSIEFNYGGGLSDLAEYREKKSVRIQVTPDGRPAITEIEAELRGYLKELRNPNRNGPIRDDGTLKNVKKLGT